MKYMFTKTFHSKKRIKERGVSPFVISLLMKYGDLKYTGGGGIIRFFNKKSKKKMVSDLGRKIFSQISRYLNFYLICSKSNVLITVGRRYKRIKNK